jgi:hypothetical protein
VVASRNCRFWFTVLAIVWLAGCARRPEPAVSPTLVGAWRASVQFRGGMLAPIKDLEFLYVFNAGGTMTESSNYDATPPVPPAYGEWRQTGPDQFVAKYVFFTTSPPSDVKSLATGGGWPPAGSGVLTERITLAADGRSYRSSITLDMFDRAGKAAEGGGEAVVRAARAEF